MIRIHIPVKPLVKHCLPSYLPEGIVDNTSVVGKYIVELLEKETNRYSKRYKSYTETAVLYVPYLIMIRDGGIFNETQALAFNNFMSMLIRIQLRTIMITYMEFDCSLSRAVIFARKQMNITEEMYSDDAINKDFTRWRAYQEAQGNKVPRVYKKDFGENVQLKNK